MPVFSEGCVVACGLRCWPPRLGSGPSGPLFVVAVGCLVDVFIYLSIFRLASANRQLAVARIFNPTLSDHEFTEAACAATRRLRAAAEGDVAALKSTKDEGDERTALMVACRARRLQAVEVLVAQGSNVNARSALGCTALYLASEEGDRHIVHLLLERGAGRRSDCGIRWQHQPALCVCFWSRAVRTGTARCGGRR